MTAGRPGATVDNEEVPSEAGCAVCPHRLADHDNIGQRFCQATQANALTRKCICSETS